MKEKIHYLKIKIIFVFAIIALLALSYFSYIRINHLIEESKLVNHTNLVKLSLEKTFAALSDKESNNRGYIFTNDSVFFASYFAVQYFFFSPPAFDKVMMAAASEINKTCPIMVDQVTRLDNAIALPENSLQYNYTLVNIESTEVNPDTVKKYIEPGIINLVKSSPDMKIYRDNKTTIIYNYRDKNGVFILKLVVTPEMYQ